MTDQHATPHDPVARIPLSQPSAGAIVKGNACLLSKTLRSDRNGNPFLSVVIGHRGGTARLMIWQSDMPRWETVEEGAALWLTLEGQPGRGTWPPSWSVAEVRALHPSHPVREDLLPQCPIAVEELDMRWDALRDQLSEDARVLLDVVIAHVGEYAYRRAPAAERLHHAVAPHGLWWHSIEVAELAVALANAVPTYAAAVNRDVLITGSLLHDIGKIMEYRVITGVGIRRAPIAAGRYHTSLGVEIVTEAVTTHRIRHFPTEVSEWLRAAVLQIIESHHALKEWGSSSPPASREAWLVHLADQASAKLSSLTEALASAQELPDDEGWFKPADPRAPALQDFAALPRKDSERKARRLARRVEAGDRYALVVTASTEGGAAALEDVA